MSQQKIKPLQIVLIVSMCLLSVAFFLFKDQIIPKANSQETIDLYKTFVPTKAVVVDFERVTGKRPYNNLVVQYWGADKELYNGKIKQALEYSGTQIGDSVVIYYNPNDPSTHINEAGLKEITQ